MTGRTYNHRQTPVFQSVHKLKILERIQRKDQSITCNLYNTIPEYNAVSDHLAVLLSSVPQSLYRHFKFSNRFIPYNDYGASCRLKSAYSQFLHQFRHSTILSSASSSSLITTQVSHSKSKRRVFKNSDHNTSNRPVFRLPIIII